jgi:protein-glutamine gamma-glutamyltransferase
MARVAPSVERFFQLSLLGLVGSGFLAVAGSGYLDVPTLILTVAGLLARAAFILGWLRFEIPDRLVTVLTIAYIGFYPLDFQFVSGEFLPATLHFVFFLAVMKILTARTNRDYLYTAAISVLELLAAALISVQLNFFIFLGCYLLFAVAALTSAEIRRSASEAGQIARSGSRRRLNPRLAALTALLTAGVLVLTGCLFFLLPRTAHAALRRLASHGYYLPGFSNEVTLGQIGEIKLQSSIVMHVRVYNRDGRLDAKWRGTSLSEFDGRRWANLTQRADIMRVRSDGMVLLAEDWQRLRRGTRVTYRVDLNPLDTDTLFLAGTPEFLTVNAASILRTSGDGYRLGMGANGGLRYDVHAYLEDENDPPSAHLIELPPPLASRYLQLPAIDPRIPRLARDAAAGRIGAMATARAVERYLRTNYGYTLQLLSQEVRDPIAYFLFDRRKGHCEYFASAMTIMLRTLGIPSRMVTGFQGGTFNPVSGMYIVRTSDAHSWVEAWIPGHGWTTFDPTPPDPSAGRSNLWTPLSMYFDAADTFWQDWVLSYDLGRQMLLADRMGRSSRNFGVDWFSRFEIPAPDLNRRAWLIRNSGWVVAALALLALMVLTGPKLWRLLVMRLMVRRLRQGHGSEADATRLYGRFLELFRERGYSKPSWFTPTEFVRTLRGGEAAQLAVEFTSAYQDLRFGGKTDAARRLSVLLGQIEALPK